MKHFTKILLTTALFTQISCVQKTGIPNNVKIPGSNIALNVAKKTLKPSKKGESCMTIILGIKKGEISINEAKKNGKISKILYFDGSYKAIQPFYSRSCLIAFGD